MLQHPRVNLSEEKPELQIRPGAESPEFRAVGKLGRAHKSPPEHFAAGKTLMWWDGTAPPEYARSLLINGALKTRGSDPVSLDEAAWPLTSTPGMLYTSEMLAVQS